MVAGKPVDQAINYALGGSIHHTISGDTGAARAAGSKSAYWWCGLYELSPLGLYDFGYFTIFGEWKTLNANLGHAGQQPNDHCGRWALYESDGYAKLKGSEQ